MSSETVHRVLDEILESFRSGRLPAALAQVYLSKTADLYSRRWSVRNQILVFLKSYSDARGYRQWQQVGRRVRKGEKAMYILRPITVTIEDPEDPRADSEGKITLVKGFRSIPVFGYEQTEGEPLTEFEHRAFLDSLPFIEVARSWGLEVGVDQVSARALGVYRRREDDSPYIGVRVANPATFAHELAHAADDRLHQLSGSRDTAEIVAELAGAALLKMIGEQTAADLGGAFEYIQAYAGRQKMEVTEACIAVLDRVAAVVDLIYQTSRKLAEETGAEQGGASGGEEAAA